ncbi:alpha/beta fold hydrolase [Streptomyces sp. 6N223]|uniref:alpha/beta fold hydrolase n=1 Tax=Streptomyces sp. 6N223 TaxID=3457412 RepID=UPI003FD52566
MSGAVNPPAPWPRPPLRIHPARLPGYPDPACWQTVPATGQHYVDAGRGDPVLLLHGNPAWSYVWRHLIAALRPDFRCLAPDHVGFGLSPRPHDPDRPLTRYLDDMDALYAHLTAERGLPARGWTFVVHDWGGPLGLSWARRRPGVLRRLVVLNTTGFRWPPGLRLPAGLRLIREHRSVARLAHLTNAFPRAAVRAGVVRPMPRAVRRAYLLPYGRPRHRRYVVEVVRRIPRGTTEEIWNLLDPDGRSTAWTSLPVFIGWGMRDPVFTPRVLEEWLRRHPDARVHRYAGAGHFVMEDAADALAADVRRFLSDTADTADAADDGAADVA